MASSRSRYAATRRRLVTAGILASGWSLAIAVYLRAAPALEEDADVYDWEHSRRYVRDLERIGGKAAVFTSDLNHFFSELWRGRSLAYLIAAVTLLVAAAYFFGRRPPPPTRPAPRRGTPRSARVRRRQTAGTAAQRTAGPRAGACDRPGGG